LLAATVDLETKKMKRKTFTGLLGAAALVMT
jgi:hypothetical protein